MFSKFKTLKTLLLGDSVESLRTESSDILDVFTKTVDELNDVNQRINDKEQEKLEEQKRLANELDALAITKTRNLKIIDNINKILE